MKQTWEIEQLQDGGGAFVVGRLEEDTVVIGREPDPGIVVQSEAISREHGVFIPFSGRWLYKDLDSTNGSWLNGVQLEPNLPTVLRINDTLQLADRVLRLRSVAHQNIESTSSLPNSLQRSIVIFSRNDAVEERLMP